MLPFLAAAGAALGGVGSLVGGLLNYKAQSDNLDYQKEAQKTSWAREDNAVQRRAADLKAAGLSQTLAAGNAAQTMAPIRTEAPQIDTQAVSNGFKGISEGALQYMALTAQKAQIDKTVEENKLLRLQQNRQELENAFMTQANPLNLKGIEQEVNFAKLANPQRLEKMALENKGLGVDNVNKALDSKLKGLGVQNSELQVVATKLQNELATLNISAAEKDLLVKQITLDQKKVDYDQSVWQNQYYRNKGAPASENFGILNPVFGAAAQASNTIDGIVRAARNKLSGGSR